MHKKRYRYKYSMEDIGRLVGKKPNTVARQMNRKGLDASSLSDVLKFITITRPDIVCQNLANAYQDK